MVTDIEKLIPDSQSLGAAGLRGLRRVVHERLSNLSDPTDRSCRRTNSSDGSSRPGSWTRSVRRSRTPVRIAAGIRCRSRASHGPRRSWRGGAGWPSTPRRDRGRSWSRTRRGAGTPPGSRWWTGWPPSPSPRTRPSRTRAAAAGQPEAHASPGSSNVAASASRICAASSDPRSMRSTRSTRSLVRVFTRPAHGKV